MTMIDRGTMLCGGVTDGGQDFASVASAVTPSEDVIDLGSGLTDCWGNTIQPEAADLVLNLQVTEAFAGANSVLTGEVLVDSDADVTGGTVLHTITLNPTIGVLGYELHIPLGKLPAGAQYMGIDFTTTGANITAGMLNVWLGLDGEKHD